MPSLHKFNKSTAENSKERIYKREMFTPSYELLALKPGIWSPGNREVLVSGLKALVPGHLNLKPGLVALKTEMYIYYIPVGLSITSNNGIKRIIIGHDPLPL